MSDLGAVAGVHESHAHTPTGWRRWVLSTNHKDIGTMYIIFAMIMGLIGGAMSYTSFLGSDDIVLDLSGSSASRAVLESNGFKCTSERRSTAA